MGDKIMISKHDALSIQFASGVAVAGDRLSSGCMAGLRDARLLTGRHCETEGKLPGKGHGSWLGAIRHLVLLEQIGKCSDRCNQEEGRHRYAYALGCFTSLSLDQSDALYALRTSFACGYSLINIPGKDSYNQIFTHKIRLCSGITAPIVTLPKKKWDGDRKSISAATQTVVNLEAIGDLVEDIIWQLLAMVDGQKLTIILRVGLRRCCCDIHFS